MGQVTARDDRMDYVNDQLVGELLRAGAKSFTGSFEVTDRATKNRARLFMYAGGLYAVDLEGYPRPVWARLRSAGLLATRTETELDLLHGLDTPDPIVAATAVERGWFSTAALANVHQELLLAALGRVICLPKVRTRHHKGETTSEFCTLPIPVDSVLDTVRMRADRLQGTWSMVTRELGPNDAVLVIAGDRLDDRSVTAEVKAMIREIDGVRSLDAIAWAVGFTRAEAVHVAAGLIRSGVARIDTETEPLAEPPHYLVPESFGSHRVDAVARVEPAMPAAPAQRLPIRPTLPPVSDVSDVSDIDERTKALEAARAEVERLTDELSNARLTLAKIEMVELVPLGIA